MKTCPAKLLIPVCLFSLVASTGLLLAQDVNNNAPPPPGYSNGMVSEPPGYGGRSGPVIQLPAFDIQIADGKLSLAPLKGQTGATNFWASGTSSVPATMENLSKYLRAVDPDLNVILAPGTGSLIVSDLKLKTRILNEIAQAISIATGKTIEGTVPVGGRPMGGGRTLAFMPGQPSSARSAVEVFNISGYIQTLGNPNEEVINQKLDELQSLIVSTLGNLHHGWLTDDPNFKYHPGTKLLIVTGKPESIDLTRKIINALNGRNANGAPDHLLSADELLDTPPAPAQK